MASVYLYGYLLERYGSKFDLDVHSASEAVRALRTFFPRFGKDIQEGEYRVHVGELDKGIDLEESTIHMKTERDIHIMPVMEGSKGGIVKTIIGALLFVASFFLPPGISQVVQSVGIMMFTAGVSMMLAPGLKKDDQENNNGVFQGDAGIANQGQAIPLLYGEMYCDVLPISVAIENEEHNVGLGDSVYQSLVGWARAPDDSTFL